MAWQRHKYQRILAYLLLFGVWILSGCGVKRCIPDGNLLLTQNHITLVGNDNSPFRPDKEQLSAQILHRPNKRVFFNKLPIYLWFYALGYDAKDTAKMNQTPWRKRLVYRMGEEPVLVDKGLAQLSANNIRNYLFNKGFFDAQVGYSIDLQGHKGQVRYHVYSGIPYRINSVFQNSADSLMVPLLDSLVQGTNAFRLWWPSDLNRFKEARESLSAQLRDLGYYGLQASVFRYEIDTLFAEKEAKITLYMDGNPSGKAYQPWTMGGVHLEIQCPDDYALNPIYHEWAHLGAQHYKMNHYPLKPYVLRRVIQVDSGQRYSQTRINQTYRGLVDMGLFSYVDMRLEPDTATHTLTLRIQAQALPRIRWMVEPQMLYSPQGSSGTNFTTSTQRSFGLAGIMSFNNLNAMGNGEQLRLSALTSFEAIFKRNDLGNFAYGLQQGFSASMTVPSFQLLDKALAKQTYERKNTVFSLSYQTESNPNFLRTSLPASVSLQFIRPNFSWYYTPLEFSYNQNELDPAFLPQLSQLDQEFVRRVFTDQLITASKVGFVYSNNQDKPGQSYFFSRLGVETSGNLHRLGRYWFEPNYNPDSSYQFFGVNYFQYAKVGAEIRVRHHIDELNTIAVRLNGGLALPYWNSDVVPYDKRYFIGGSNSLRAWQPRRLGPGATPESVGSLIDRSGELLLEASIEYRFGVIKNFLESALFLDAGNIWNLSAAGVSNPDYGIFNRNTALSEVALNTGIGFRFDVEIFMFRLDWGIPIRDPSKNPDQRWVMKQIPQDGIGTWTVKETAVAIGIGYPF